MGALGPATSQTSRTTKQHQDTQDTHIAMADFEALKDQWSEIEDRDGIRLSWNTFPSSRMVRPLLPLVLTWMEC